MDENNRSPSKEEKEDENSRREIENEVNRDGVGGEIKGSIVSGEQDATGLMTAADEERARTEIEQSIAEFSGFEGENECSDDNELTEDVTDWFVL